MEQQFEATIRVRAPIGIAADVLVTDAASVVAERRHRHPDIEAATTERRRGLSVEFSPARVGTDEAALPIRWTVARDGQPISAFAGELEVRGDHPGSWLTLRGTYTVSSRTPAAARGDEVHVAERALSAFLSQAGRRLDNEVDRRQGSIAWHPAPYPDTLRPTGSENYLG